MKLVAIADLHLAHKENREALHEIGSHPDDWLIVAGDVGEQLFHLTLALEILTKRFARVIWVPGNHDLWCPSGESDRTCGEARYDELVAECRQFGVLTPEDPYVRWPGDTPVATYLVPMFLLFDYSFRPPEISREEAVGWARASGVVAGDEAMLRPDPWPSREAWCHARCALTAARLDALPADAATILINHWPLRYDLARPPRVPRFSLWSGTTLTEDWGRRYRALTVISGHLHLRSTLARHGVRYDEVSLGYPRDWKQERGIDYYLREILPVPDNRFALPRDPYR
jgi:3',5'-cyclic AMP phosphodiesterase CpdA